MDGENTNGGQQETQTQQEAQANGQESQQQKAQGQQEVVGNTPDYEKQIAERGTQPCRTLTCLNVIPRIM